MTRRRQRRSNKPRNQRLARTQNGVTQNGVATSHQDNVSQVRKFFSFRTLPITNINSDDYSFGLKSFNIQGSDEPYKSVIGSYSSLYEQYRVRKVVVRAQVGKGFTNDDRIKTYCVARVDVDHQLTSPSTQNLQSLLNAENTITKTFTERGNVLLAVYRPQCRIPTDVPLPILNNRQQWYSIGDLNNNVWKGVTVAAVIADPAVQPSEKAITVSLEYDVEFRGRIMVPTLLGSTMYEHNPIADAPVTISQDLVNPIGGPVTYDLTESPNDLKTKLLTGVYHPGAGFNNINIGNIGATVTAHEIMGAEFRDNPTGTWYKVAAYTNAQVSSNLRD